MSQELLESRWGETKEALLEGLNGTKRNSMSVVLENTRKYLKENASSGSTASAPTPPLPATAIGSPPLPSAPSSAPPSPCTRSSTHHSLAAPSPRSSAPPSPPSAPPAAHSGSPAAPGSGAYVGGKNQVRKEFLHEGQIRSFKGDIVPGQSFTKMNAECKSYKDFPFHQLFQGSCKQLDEWIDQCVAVADEGDFNIIFMKFNRKGKFIAVEFDKNTDLPLFVERHFLYDSAKWGRWAVMDYDKFWTLNRDMVRVACA